MKQITKVRKAVCAMANQLRKAGYSLKDAFKKAWQRVKLTRAICSQCGHDGYFAMCYAYQYGIIQGKRAERARRKRGDGA